MAVVIVVVASEIVVIVAITVTVVKVVAVLVVVELVVEKYCSISDYEAIASKTSSRICGRFGISRGTNIVYAYNITYSIPHIESARY